MEIATTVADVAGWLVEDGHEVDPTMGQDRVLFGVAHEGWQSSCLLVWPAEVALLNLMVPLPFEIPEGREAAVAEACVRLNHLLILPGFGVDMGRRLAYFRTVTPRQPDGSLDRDAVRRAIGSAVATAARFTPLVGSVADGDLTPEAIEAALEG